MTLLFPEPRPVVSASRRTDLVRCYPEVLTQWLAAGRVLVPNPFSRKIREVDLRPENVHTLLLWSKDYARLLANEHGLKDLVQVYAQLFFHITLTGLGSTALEPGVRPPQAVSRQFAALVRLAKSPERVQWRLDPLVVWREGLGVKTNLRPLAEWMRLAVDAGLKSVTVSLCQDYAKVRRRFAAAGVKRVSPTAARVRTLGAYVMELSARFGLETRSCGCPPLVAAGLLPARCVDAELLARLHPQGWPAPGGKDAGQRPGCGCAPSVDIGDYSLSCPQGCLYCYANPK